MTETLTLPAAVDAAALLSLSGEHHARLVRPLGAHEADGHLVKAYALEKPGRVVAGVEAGLELAAGHLALGSARGSLGLAVLILHAGGDGDYVLLHTWIEAHMSDLAVFVGPADDPAGLRPGRAGLAPCVWEAAILAHEREAFTRHVLDGGGPIEERVSAWSADVISGEVR
ncbi:hypothetical protein ACIBEJ_12770 [Nonomuraea sp. NPDC050790]|uniref:hypothetical protein n=1 Tax=Nonomuraea sp. NPDC050790 TaxID=3364371 RepID=UPI0037BBE518